jgi:hypothetical protein
LLPKAARLEATSVATAAAAVAQFSATEGGAVLGARRQLRDDWEAQVAEPWMVSPFAAELSALSETQLGPLRDYIATAPNLPFRYLSIHGPSKDRCMGEDKLVAQLCDLAARADGIVMHPDTIEKSDRYRVLGRKLLFENLDARKDWGRTREELVAVFADLPEAGFCFDIAHAWSINPDMSVAAALLDGFGDRLRHVHVSSLSPDLHHVPLTEETRSCSDQSSNAVWTFRGSSRRRRVWRDS